MADFEKKTTLITVEIDQEASKKEVLNLTGAIVEQKNAVQENNAEIKGLNKANKDLSKEVEKGTKTQAEASKEIGANKTKIDSLKKSNILLGDGIKDLNSKRTQAVKVTKLQSNSLDALRSKVVSQKKELNGLNTETEKGSKRFDELTKELEENNQAIKNADQSAGDFKTTIGDYKTGTDDAIKGTDAFTGGLGSAAKGMINLVKQSIVFLATPIGLAIGALAVGVMAVKAAFEGSEEGQNKFNKLSGIIGVVIGNLNDLLADFGEFIIEAFENPQDAVKRLGDIIKENFTNRLEGLTELIPQLGKAVSQLFEGDFSGAAETAGNAVVKVGLGIDDVSGKIAEAAEATKNFLEVTDIESKKAIDVAKKRADADLLARTLLVEGAKLESEISALRLKSRQEDQFGAEERKQALLDAQELQDQLLKQEQEVLRLRSEAITAENTFSRSSKENLDAEAAAKAELLKVEARRLDQQRSTQRELNRINKEIEADSNRSNKEIEKGQEDLNKRLDELAETKRDQDEERRLSEAESEAERFEIEKEILQERFEEEQESLAEQREIALENEVLSKEERQLVIDEFDAMEQQAKMDNTAALAKIQDKADKDDLKKLKEKQKAVSGFTKEATKVAKDALNSKFDDQEARVQQNFDKELAGLESSLESGSISEEVFAKKKEALEKSKAKALHNIKVKEFRANQKTSAAEIVVDTAKGVIKAVAASPLTGGLPFSALVGGLGLFRLGQVLAEKPPAAPSFAKGGDVMGFTVGGQLHSQGGTTYTGEDGNRFEVERGEGIFVTKREATNPALSMLSGVNESFGGRSMFSAPKKYLQEGGSAIGGGMTASDVANIIESTAANLPTPTVKVQSIMGAVNAEVEAEEIGIV